MSVIVILVDWQWHVKVLLTHMEENRDWRTRRFKQRADFELEPCVTVNKRRVPQAPLLFN